MAFSSPLWSWLIVGRQFGDVGYGHRLEPFRPLDIVGESCTISAVGLDLEVVPVVAEADYS